MRTLAWRLCTLFALTLPIACQRQNSVELTLVARGLNLETQISALRETATIGAERLQITVEYMATRAAVARRQRQELEHTLVARGSPAPGSSTVPTGTPFPLPGTTLPTALAAPSASLTPLAPGQAALTNVIMAAYVRNDDCASEPVYEFATNSDRIYIVATAHNVRAGTLLAARFVISGREVLHEWRPGSSIDGNCIWFFVDQSDLPFAAGTWNARLELNETPASGAITFSIRDADGQAL